MVAAPRTSARNLRSLAAQKLGILGSICRENIGVYIGAKLRGKIDSFGAICVELVSSLFLCRA
jgi:hypothetical protein